MYNLSTWLWYCTRSSVIREFIVYDFRLIGAGNSTLYYSTACISRKGIPLSDVFYRMTLDAVSWHFDFPGFPLVNRVIWCSGHGAHVMPGFLLEPQTRHPLVNKQRKWNFITLWMFSYTNHWLLRNVRHVPLSGSAQGLLSKVVAYMKRFTEAFR